ncbi:hypothetical protein B0H13DRAFT_2402202 [Mycena leptocephala]|nr:hypothetical protein B0H13DRAFT_2402202 [Mycena leptocephala]
MPGDCDMLTGEMEEEKLIIGAKRACHMTAIDAPVMADGNASICIHHRGMWGEGASSSSVCTPSGLGLGLRLDPPLLLFRASNWAWGPPASAQLRLRLHPIGRKSDGEVEVVMSGERHWDRWDVPYALPRTSARGYYHTPLPIPFYTVDGARGTRTDIINVSGRRLSTASALIMYKGVAETAVDGVGGVRVCDAQAVRGFLVLLLPLPLSPPPFGIHRRCDNEAVLAKELVLQVRKVIRPFAAPKEIYIVPDLSKTRLGSERMLTSQLFTSPLVIFRVGKTVLTRLSQIMRKIVADEGDRLGDLSTVRSRVSRTEGRRERVGLGEDSALWETTANGLEF